MNRFKSGLLALAIWAVYPIIGLPLALAQQEISLQGGWTVQSSAKVREAPEKISSPGYNVSDWYKASAPETVFAVLVENGVYPSPYFGMNLRSIPGVEYPVAASSRISTCRPTVPTPFPGGTAMNSNCLLVSRARTFGSVFTA